VVEGSNPSGSVFFASHAALKSASEVIGRLQGKANFR
jgi:hypothetical protein